jgi:hypothetical protein
MAQTLRTTVQDFMSAVRGAPNAATGKYAATLNSDGTVKISINATGVVVWPNVYWQMGPTSAATDANISNDAIRLLGNGNGVAVGCGDAQQFLNSLT